MSKSFIIRTILFVAFSVIGFYIAVMCVFMPFSLVASLIFNALKNILINSYNITEARALLIFIIFIAIAPFVLSPIICWLYAKIFGYFKELDKLDLSKKRKYVLLVILSLLILTILLLPLQECVPLIIYEIIDINNISAWIILALPLSYFLYTKANELTPKYKLLQKIGYICSARFVKDTFKKAREKFCHGKKE